MKHIRTLIFWKDIPDYEGIYQANQFGEIRSLPKPMPNGGYTPIKKMNPHGTDKDGYLVVGLTKDGKQQRKRWHRIIAETFLPNPDDLAVVDHINRCITDNRVSNLQWISAKQNTVKDCGRHPKCVETGIFYESLSEAQRQTGVDRRSISRCCEGQQKTAGKLHWEWC